jgi:hypothetical protein
MKKTKASLFFEFSDTLALILYMYSRGSRFLIYNFLQFAIDGKNNSKTKVEKAFFFMFMSSYAEMSFFKIKNHKIGPKNFCV